MTRTITIALSSAFLAGSALAETRTLEVPVDDPVHLSNPHNWDNSNCKTGWVNVVVIEVPKNGTVYTEEVIHKLGDFGRGRLTSGSLGNCEGTLIQDGVGVFYDPIDGFNGTDTFSVTFDYEFIPSLELNYIMVVGQ